MTSSFSNFNLMRCASVLIYGVSFFQIQILFYIVSGVLLVFILFSMSCFSNVCFSCVIYMLLVCRCYCHLLMLSKQVLYVFDSCYKQFVANSVQLFMLSCIFISFLMLCSLSLSLSLFFYHTKRFPWIFFFNA